MRSDEIRQRTVTALESFAGAVGSPAGQPVGRTVEDQVWVEPSSPCADPNHHQLVLFLKPEVTTGSRFAPVLDLLLAILDEHAVEIGAIRIVSGAFLERTQTMQKHYGVINSVSRLGETVLSEPARVTLRERFGDDVTAENVVGGHQFLRDYPQVSAYALHLLFGNLGNVRLAPGTYACGVSVEGRDIVLLNGFHPYQLERFTEPTAVTVLLEGRTATPWTVLRRQVAGATDPAKAVGGSFRRNLLERADQLGIPSVSQNYNGLHLSAGPLEGMVEMQRFFGEADELPAERTCFGRLLADSGLSRTDVARLAENPSLKVDGRIVSAFDLTEELDSGAAAAALTSALANQ